MSPVKANMIMFVFAAAAALATAGWTDVNSAILADSGTDCVTFETLCKEECSPGEYYKTMCLEINNKKLGNIIKKSACKCKTAGGRAAAAGGDTDNTNTGAAPSAELTAWRTAMYTRHNVHRANHDAPDLTADATIEAVAQAFAEHLATNGLWEHSKDSPYGENLAGGSGTFTDGHVAMSVDMWYNEVNAYDFNAPGFGMDTGHFTQVVWKGSTKIGCGISQGTPKWIVVCNYDPPGNVAGQFPANVVAATSK